MAKETDQVVGNIYETFDYDKFSIVPENRGHKETKGLKAKKLKTLQRMIDAGTWIHEMARVKVNENFLIIDGAHTFEVSKRNGFSIRYEITKDPHFNNVPKRDLVGSIYSINSVTTSWSAQELFEAAVSVKAPAALLMNAILEEHENYFGWLDIMALLLKEPALFNGRWRALQMKDLERKDLVEQLGTNEFGLEIKSFAKMNLKCRIARKRGVILKATYDILWFAGEMINKVQFRKAVQSLPEHLVTSERTYKDDPCRRLLIQHYNKSQGQKVELEAVMFALKHKDKKEEVLEMT